jgi:NTE family protein
VALGGGGARGNAHVGVLRVLDEEGFNIGALAGTSYGGVVGSLYAAGYSPDEIEERFSEVDQAKLYVRTPDDRSSILGLSGAREFLAEMLGDRKFSDLRMPFAVTAVDLNFGDEVLLNEGSVLDAIMATIAIPGLLPPKQLGDKLLIDGAVLDPVPVGVARSLADPGDPVIAVTLSPKLGEKVEVHEQQIFGSTTVIKALSRLRIAQAFGIFVRSVDIGGRLLSELRLELENPDVIVRPDVHHIGTFDRIDVSEVIRLGEDAAREVLPEIKFAVSWRGRLTRALRGVGQAISGA